MADLLEYYLNLTPDKIVGHLEKLFDTEESEIFILRNENDLKIFEEGLRAFSSEFADETSKLEWSDEDLQVFDTRKEEYNTVKVRTVKIIKNQ